MVFNEKEEHTSDISRDCSGSFFHKELESLSVRRTRFQEMFLTLVVGWIFFLVG